MNDIFHSNSQPLERLHPTVHNLVSLIQNAMKKFIVRFWFACIIIVVLTMEIAWVLLVSSGNNAAGSSLVTQFLFPVLFVLGTISHVLARRNQ